MNLDDPGQAPLALVKTAIDKAILLLSPISAAPGDRHLAVSHRRAPEPLHRKPYSGSERWTLGNAHGT